MKNNSTKSEKCIKRSEKVNKILTQLEHGTKELFNSERYQKYLVTFSKFTNYSINNTILIYLQNPNATLVAGCKARRKGNSNSCTNEIQERPRR